MKSYTIEDLQDLWEWFEEIVDQRVAGATSVYPRNWEYSGEEFLNWLRKVEKLLQEKKNE